MVPGFFEYLPNYFSHKSCDEILSMLLHFLHHIKMANGSNETSTNMVVSQVRVFATLRIAQLNDSFYAFIIMCFVLYLLFYYYFFFLFLPQYFNSH